MIVIWGVLIITCLIATVAQQGSENENMVAIFWLGNISKMYIFEDP